MGGAGDDRLIGSPFNDVIDGGTSDAQATRSPAASASTSSEREHASLAVDTLVETQDTDMGLYGNTFITGNALDDAGTTRLRASPPASYAPRTQLATDHGTNEDGRTRSATRTSASRATASSGRSATVEDITGIFATAQLTGGAGQQHDRRQRDRRRGSSANGSARTVTTWNGDAMLDNGGNTAATRCPSTT